MARKINPGSFRANLTLLRPGKQERDEMGGLKDREYKEAIVLKALKRDKTTTYKQVIGDYVTVDTVYFVANDILSVYPIDSDWRIKHDGAVYLINHITRLDDSAPYYMEIEATKIGGGGVI